MDEFKWAWVLIVAAMLALMVRLAMWLFPAPGWRFHKVSQAADSLPAQVEGPSETSAPEENAGPEELAPPPALAVTVFRPPAAPPPAEPVPPPPPEAFHLRQTRWGMTLDEVRAAERAEPIRQSNEILVYSTTTLEMPCLLTYSFVQGQLARAHLAFSDPTGKDIPPLSVAQAQRRFLYLREQLRTRYGEPVQKTTYLPRDVTDLRRHAEKQDELAKQYDLEITEAELRTKKQLEVLETRFARWPNRTEMVARGLASYERDLRELRTWKQEALEGAEQSRRKIRERKEADAARPLLATMSARWPFARELHDIELRLDCRQSVPRLEIRYDAAPNLSGQGGGDEL